MANRAVEVQKLTANGKWQHVCSELNPTDVLSRGVVPDEIRGHRLWWNGPKFLYEDYSKASDDSPGHIDELPEVKKQAIALKATSEDKLNIIGRFSSLKRLKRTVAYCL